MIPDHDHYLFWGERWGLGFRQQEVGGGERGAAGGSSLQNLHAMVAGVSHDDAPVAVDGDTTTRVVELPVA